MNERFVNIPAKIADPLLTSLQGEIHKISKKDPSYNFDYLIMICKTHKQKGNQTEAFFANAEEEVFYNKAICSFEFDVSEESDTSVSGKWGEGDAEMIPFRKVLILNGKEFPSIVQNVRQFVA